MHQPARPAAAQLQIADPNLAAFYRNLTSVILGEDHTAELLIVGLLARGHVLIQGPPGIGKTTIAKAVARSLDLQFRRVQFTPDLLPADILGYSVYDQGRHQFVFHPGPIFTHVLLADEINRTTPRVQSALLEAMNEEQVTIDGETRRLDSPFLVIATQNPSGAAGTFPLPESQLDRFLISCPMGLPAADIQADILRLHRHTAPVDSIAPAITREQILALQARVLQVDLQPAVARYIVDLAEATRQHAALRPGVSTRAAMALMRAAQARAVIEGRSAVFPDDVKALAAAVFLHRVAAVRKRGHSVAAADAIAAILDETPVP